MPPACPPCHAEVPAWRDSLCLEQAVGKPLKTRSAVIKGEPLADPSAREASKLTWMAAKFFCSCDGASWTKRSQLECRGLVASRMYRTSPWLPRT